jgi:exonuclease III
MNIFLYKRYRKIYKNADGLLYVIYKKDKIYIAKYFKKNGVVKKEHKHLIQQKSKKIGGGSKTLVVCSFNVYTWNGYNTKRDNFIEKFKKLISEKKVDLLLTQEDQHDIKYDTSESVKAYSLKMKEEDPKRYLFSSCISTSLQFCKGIVPRNAIIIEDTQFGITIANLLLEGGRFVDTELDDDKFKIYLEIKLALLKEVLGLEQKPHIISGDFNSVFCNDPDLLKQMHEDQKAYYDGSCNSKQATSSSFSSDKDYTEGYLYPAEKQLQDKLGVYLIQKCPNNCGDKDKKALTLEQVISWNNAPFLLLKEAGYEYIEPTNIKTTEGKINPTNSRGNNVIDHFWVKSSLLDKYTFRTEIYDGFGEIDKDNLYGGISDHKPVILTIQSNIEDAKQDAKGATEQGTLPSKRKRQESRK